MSSPQIIWGLKAQAPPVPPQAVRGNPPPEIDSLLSPALILTKLEELPRFLALPQAAIMHVCEKVEGWVNDEAKKKDKKKRMPRDEVIASIRSAGKGTQTMHTRSPLGATAPSGVPDTS